MNGRISKKIRKFANIIIAATKPEEQLKSRRMTISEIKRTYRNNPVQVNKFMDTVIAGVIPGE